jgi:hypothetical protein
MKYIKIFENNENTYEVSIEIQGGGTLEDIMGTLKDILNTYSNTSYIQDDINDNGIYEVEDNSCSVKIEKVDFFK